jgi:hypothetical protein
VLLFVVGASAFRALSKSELEFALEECCRGPGNNRDIIGGVFDNDCIVDESGTYSTTGGTHIRDWDTGSVSDMSHLFNPTDRPCFLTFNAEIGRWNTSQVTTLYGTFNGAEQFNAPLSWDTRRVTSISYMFAGASAFMQTFDLNTSSVVDKDFVFSKFATRINSYESWNAFVRNVDVSTVADSALAREISTRPRAYQLAKLCKLKS